MSKRFNYNAKPKKQHNIDSIDFCESEDCYELMKEIFGIKKSDITVEMKPKFEEIAKNMFIQCDKIYTLKFLKLISNIANEAEFVKKYENKIKDCEKIMLKEGDKLYELFKSNGKEINKN